VRSYLSFHELSDNFKGVLISLGFHGISWFWFFFGFWGREGRFYPYQSVEKPSALA